MTQIEKDQVAEITDDPQKWRTLMSCEKSFMTRIAEQQERGRELTDRQAETLEYIRRSLS